MAAPIALEGALSVADVYERAGPPGQEVILKGLVRGTSNCCEQHGEKGNPCERECAHRHVIVVDAPRAPRFLVLLLSGSGPPELRPYGYYAFRAKVPEAGDDLPKYSSGGRDAPVLEYRAHQVATAPTAVLTPSYDDGSWSIADLGKRFDLEAPQQVKVTAYVRESYVCPPCPPKAVCKPCMKPYLTLTDSPQGSDGAAMLVHSEEQPPKWRVKVGQRYVFTGTLRAELQLAMNFQAQAPSPAKPPPRPSASPAP